MQKIRDQLEDSITEKVTRQLILSFSQMQSQFQSQMQSQGLALPPEPEVGPSAARVAQRRVVLIPQGTTKTRVTQRNGGCASKKILPAWLS